MTDEATAAKTPLRVLVVDDEANIRLTLSVCLEADGHHVTAHSNIHDALLAAAHQAFDLIFLDLRLGLDNGMDFIPKLLTESPWTRIVVITAYASVETAVEAMKRGATDYLPKPFSPAQVQMVTQKVAERRKLEWQIQSLQEAMGSVDPEADFPAASSAMRNALQLARQVAGSEAAVLITGESGVGKGRLARAIHAWSRRSAGPYAITSCRAEDAAALDAEWFGEAVSGRAGEIPGRLAVADGGTLLLENIDQTPWALQPKLLRLLRDREYERPRDFATRKANVRFIATAERDPQLAVDEGKLRSELLLAINVVRVEVPSLRERAEDIPLLAERYLAYFGKQNRWPIAGFTPSAMRALKRYRWPGNVRELRNLVERAVLLCNTDHVGLEHFPRTMLEVDGPFAVGDLVPMETIEDAHVRRVLMATGSIQAAATVLNVDRGTVRRWLRRHPEMPSLPECDDSKEPAH